ncbi:MAG: ABC transporter permease subunit [Thermoanaerobaculia bacterium]|nr:ABC transporter permease subunit [Thermoanaerobaculia bacterium]
MTDSSDSRPDTPTEVSPNAPSPGVMSFTGRRRKRTTRASVVFADKAARILISVGGVGTILSVLGVALFLLWVVLPLFLPAKVDDLQPLDVASRELVHVAVDEYQILAWVLLPSGEAEVFRLDNGEFRARQQLFPEGSMVTSSFLLRSSTAAFGLVDGTVQLADVGFDTDILDADELPSDVVAQAPEENDVASYEDGVVQRTPTGQFRYQRLRVEMGPSTRVSTGPVQRLDLVVRNDGPLIAALADGSSPASESAEPLLESELEDGSLDAEPEVVEAETVADTDDASMERRLLLVAFEEDTNFLTGETTMEVGSPVKVPLDSGSEDALLVALSGPGTELYVAWANGELRRWNIRDLGGIELRESGRLWDDEASLGFFEPILGGNTFLVGDSEGRVNAGFPVRTADAVDSLPLLHGRGSLAETTTMGFVLSKRLTDASSAALSMAPSSRSRLAMAGFSDGEVRLFNITNASLLKSFTVAEGEAVRHLVMAPKEDGALAVTDGGMYHAHLDPRFPEAGFSAFFRPVWYEGYAKPQHSWQSSSGTDDFEMKLGLMPLVFGTLKATFYSMLFGAPLALLAAIFTSEFLHGRVRSVIKPSIELMASLPSVVLGFLAALVFAPYIEKVVPATLGVFLTLPLTLLLGAFLWQLLPSSKAILWKRWRFLLIGLLIPVGIWLAGALGPVIERLVFSGDIKGWLAWNPGDDRAERFGSPFGGWLMLTLPLSAAIVAWAFGRWVNPLMREKGSQWERRRYALVDLGRFVAGIVASLLLACLLAYLAGTFGFDPRGGYVDTYVQRNALVVGFVMGFAIIPIIYTISEDALSTVPEHLRSASLGAGATTWQTAVRIVIPTAMSGLFSALMIGLGRAVGETMIVLMAAGNTPVMELNMFEGFRTLSANIAVELPEAVNGSTHYRTLFLAALVLFVMTFLVNTVAEVIRQRFRKRAYQL